MNLFRNVTVTVLLAMSLLPGFRLAVAAETDAAGLLDKSGVKSGLCLVVGAKDTELAVALASKSALYVQILFPDVQAAQKAGAAFALSPLREKLGVRNAAFDPEHYGTNLFNLIVVEDAAALGKAKLADLCRILVPKGVMVLRTAPADMAAEAKELGLEALTLSGVAGTFRTPLKPVEWKPADSLKWRAGMRAHMSTGICGPTHGAGRFYYREWMEAEGWPKDTTNLVARDAYNGRVLWVIQENVPWNTYGAGMFARANWTMAADEAGRLFVITKDRKLVCLDGATGQQLFELSAKAGPGYVQTHLNKYVLYANTVYSAADGKMLFSWGSKSTMTLYAETLLESDGRTLRVRNLADGTDVFKADLASWRGDRVAKPFGLLHVGSHIIVTEGGGTERPFRATALNPKTGEKIWSHEFGGIFAMPFRGEKGKTFTGDLSYYRQGDKLVAYCCTMYFHADRPDPKEVHFTSLDLATGKPIKEDYGPQGKLFGSTCNNGKGVLLGDYLFYWHNVWLKTETFERSFPFLVHPNCFLPSPAAYGMIYNAPGRKGGCIQGITSIGPADIAFDQAPGGKLLVPYGQAPAGEPTAPADWPTFRGGNARGNAFPSELGLKLTKAWETQVGLGGASYGQMYAERTGLTQATVAYGTAYVADIGAQRVVALNVADGKQQWAYHVGSRVDFPPTLYKGLCLVASKDGFVHCLNAKTGAPVYKLLIAPRERYVGGQEKLESLWPTAADVMVGKDGVARASAGFASTIHGGYREVAFKPEMGEVVEAKVNFEAFQDSGYPGPKSAAALYTEPLPGGWRLTSCPIDDMLAVGNSVSRTNEDRAGMLLSDQERPRAGGRAIAFDEKLCVAHYLTYGGQSWATQNPMHLVAVDKDPKKPLWKSEPVELTADDILLTPSHALVLGHYRRVDGSPEIWTVSRENGKVLEKTPVPGFPSFFGLSAAGNRVFVSTREGKLICYEAK